MNPLAQHPVVNISSDRVSSDHEYRYSTVETGTLPTELAEHNGQFGKRPLPQSTWDGVVYGNGTEGVYARAFFFFRVAAIADFTP